MMRSNMVTEIKTNCMNRLFILTLVATALLTGCKKDSYMPFHSTASIDNIYFNFDPKTSDRDSIIYTFAYTPGKITDTIYLPVQISGNRSATARRFTIAVTDSLTTAIPGIHYSALKDTYTLPAGAGFDSIPLVLFNTDSLMSRRSVSLSLHLAATDDLGVQIADVIKARIIFSNKLEKPVWWDKWMLNYSDVKFELFIIATGVTALASGDDYGLYAPQSLYYMGLMNILLNDPFTWVADNPEKGYALELRSDGNYDFYNTANPSHKLLVKKDLSAGRYFFIDENGAQVI